MDILASLHPILKRCLTLYGYSNTNHPQIQILPMLFLVNNNDIHLMIISEHAKEFLGTDTDTDQKA